MIEPSSEMTVAGGLMTYCRHPDHTTACRPARTMATASSFGHTADQRRCARPAASTSGVSRASSPRRSASRYEFGSAPMTADLLAQSVGDLGGALLHPARQLVGPVASESFEMDQAQQFVETPGPRLGRYSAQPHRQVDVAGDGEPGEERRLLEQHADAPV